MQVFDFYVSNNYDEGDNMHKKIIMFVIILGILVFHLGSYKKIETVQVEIKGAVKNPGVYELDLDSRVNDLIKKSGGLKKDADTSILNLSKQLKNEEVIVVYTTFEIENMKKGSTSIKYIERECTCPKIENSVCFDDIIENSESIINKTGKVSLNTATLEELLTIPSIGESKADLIIEYRNKIGFKEIEDIMNVKGIGSGIFEKIKNYITL